MQPLSPSASAHTPCPLPSAVENANLQAQFTARVPLKHLKYRISPTWVPTAARPRPEWKRLCNAPLYKLRQYEGLLEALRKPPSTIEATSRKDLLTLTVTPDDDKAKGTALTVFRAGAEEGVPEQVVETPLYAGIWEVQGPEQKVPPIINACLRRARPVMLFGDSSSVDAAKELLEKAHRQVLTRTVAWYQKPHFLNPSWAYTFEENKIALMGIPGDNMSRQVHLPALCSLGGQGGWCLGAWLGGGCLRGCLAAWAQLAPPTSLLRPRVAQTPCPMPCRWFRSSSPTTSSLATPRTC